MKSTLIILLIIIVLCGLFFFPNYGLLDKPRMIPEKSLPDREIVYYNFDPPNDKTPLIFIDADGRNMIERNIIFPFGLFFKWNPIKKHVQIKSQLTWSNDGQYLGFLAGDFPNPNHGYPIIVSKEEQFYSCFDSDESPTTSKRIRIVEDTTILIIDESDNRSESVILYDVKTCKEKSSLYEANENEHILATDLSSQGWLAMVVSQSSEESIRIIKSDKTMISIDLFARDLSWSPDGEWLAVVVYEEPDHYNLYIMKKDGTQQSDITRASHSPSWDSDGKWVVYDLDGKIMKTDVETGDTVILGDGMFPSWRWVVP